jgi:tape measure domain-containing protein
MGNVGTVTVVMDANDIALMRKLKKADAQVKKTGTRMRSGMQKSMSRLMISMKAMAVTAALVFGKNLIGNIVQAGLAMDRFGRTFKVAMGSARSAAEEMAWVTSIANKLGINLLVAANAYAKLTAASKGTALAGRGTRDIFESLSMATMVLGLSAQDTGQILTAVEQMISKGKVAAEELRRQMQKLPGAFQMAARAMNMTTAALDKALKNGEVLAQDMLPGLSRELNATFGPELENAMRQPQAVFGRFSNSIIQLKATIAESGLMELLTAMAKEATAYARAIKFVADKHRDLDARNTLGRLRENIAPKFDELKEARARMNSLKGAVEAASDPGLLARKLAEVTAEVTNLEAQYDAMRKAAVLAHKAMQESNVEIKNALPPSLPEGFDAFVKKHMPTGFLVDQLLKELELMKPHILETYPGMYEQAKRSILEIGDKATDSIVASYGSQMQIAALKASKAIKAIMASGLDSDTIAAMIKRVHEEYERATELNEIIPITSFKKSMDTMSEHAKQAAKNMQDAFADFLFDPFSEGLKGMLRGFLDVIRRIMAESIAANIFDSASKSGSGFASFINAITGKAGGGPITAGTPYMVGERGPEIVVPGRSGTVIPNNALGGNNYYFEAGADVATIMSEIVPALEQTKNAAVEEIFMHRKKGLI